MEKQTVKLKNIEFLRFIFVLIVIYAHLPMLAGIFKDNNIYTFLSTKSSFSCLVVDFFFILSGFFLKYSFNKDIDVFDFLKKKVVRLWPVAAFAITWYICLRFFNIASYGSNFYENVYSYFFIDNIGMTLVHCGPTWYVSVLILVSLFYFYLYKTFSDKTANLIIGMFVWFSYVFTINVGHGMICEHLRVVNDFICMGLLRGLGGIGLGIFLYYTYQKYKDVISGNNKIFYTLLEGGILFWCLYSLIKSTHYITNHMIFIIAFFILIFLFLIKKGYISQFFNNNLSVFIGKYTYSIFLTHIIFLYILVGTIWNVNNNFAHSHAIISLILIYLICIIIGILTYHFIEKPQNKLYQKAGFWKYYITIFLVMICGSAIFGNIISHKNISMDKNYLFSRNYLNIQNTGLSNIEAWGRWSDGNNVEIKFYVPKEDLLIHFNINPFLVDNKQIAEIYANDKLVNTWYFDNINQTDTTVYIPKELISKHNKVSLKFNILNAQSPKKLHLSRDRRKLGLGFVDMNVHKGSN